MSAFGGKADVILLSLGELNNPVFLSTYGPIYNLLNVQRHLISRSTLRTFRNSAMKEWMVVTAAV